MAIRRQRIGKIGRLPGDTALIEPPTVLTPRPNPVPYQPAELPGKLAPPQRPAIEEPQTSEPEGPESLVQRLIKKWEDGNDILGQLRSAWEESPQREDYSPSTGRRIAAGAVGGLTGLAEGPQAGISAARGIIDSPYQDAYQDWVSQTGALERQAGLELQGRDISDRGLADLLRYQASLDQYDPDIQGPLVEALGKAGAPVVEQQQDFLARQAELEIESREDIAEANRQSAREISDAIIAGRAKEGEAGRATALQIAQARAQLGAAGGRVNPGQQSQSKMMAENIAATLLPDEENKLELFYVVEIEDGPNIWVLKDASDIGEEFHDVYQQMRHTIDELTDQIMGGTGYDDPTWDIRKIGG